MKYQVRILATDQVLREYTTVAAAWPWAKAAANQLGQTLGIIKVTQDDEGVTYSLPLLVTPKGERA